MVVFTVVIDYLMVIIDMKFNGSSNVSTIPVPIDIADTPVIE